MLPWGRGARHLREVVCTTWAGFSCNEGGQDYQCSSERGSVQDPRLVAPVIDQYSIPGRFFDPPFLLVSVVCAAAVARAGRALGTILVLR